MKRLVFLVLALFATHAAFSQARNAQLTGTVSDPSGARLGSARIIATNTKTGIAYNATANASGEYTVPELPPGPYKLSASSAGFRSEERVNVVLDTQQQARIDFALLLGNSEVINVQDAPPLLDSQTSDLGTVIDNRKVADLPLNGRSFYSLALLAPGVLPPAQNSTNSFRGGFNVAGQAETANNFYLNGIINVDEIANYPAYRPSVETIEQFKILTGTYAAEYGLRFGGQVEVVTKSGGNRFHGDLFEFLRNQVTDSKPYFLTTGAVPTLKQNQFGGTLGGPIWKDHTFFFFGYEGIRLRQGVAVLTTVPTGQIDAATYGNMRTGDFRGLLTPADTTKQVHIYVPGTTTNFSTPNVVDSAYLNAYGQQLANIYPEPTFRTAVGTLPSNNYLNTDVSRESGNQGSLRIDHRIGTRDTLFLNYNLFNDPNYGAYSGQCGSSVLPGMGCDQTTVSQLAAIGETHAFTANLINEFRIGGNRFHQKRSVDAARYSYRNFLNTNGLVPTPGGAGLTIALTNYAGTSFGMVPNNRYDTAKQVSDSLTLIHGKHTFKAGYTWISNLAVYVHDYQGSSTLTFQPATGTGAGSGIATFNSTGYDYSDLLIGHPSASTLSPLSILANTHPTLSNHLFYIQDDWKILNNLTLNYGVRYELATPLHSTDGLVSTFDPTIAGGGFRVANGQNGTEPYPYHYDKNNFAPRLGFSWRPLNTEKTVLRGGYGTYFYSTPTMTTGLGGFVRQVPFTVSAYSFSANKTTTQLALTNSSSLYPISGGTAQPTTGLGFDQRIATPYVQQYSLGVEQALTNNLRFEVSYLGSTGSKIYNTININQPAPNAANTTTALQNAARPLTKWGNITWAQSAGKANYNSLLAKLQQNYGNGLSFIVSYTYAHSVDNTAGLISAGDSSKALPQNSYDLRAEKGSSDFDIKHRIVVSPVYDLPFGKHQRFLNEGWAAQVVGGWKLSGIFSAQTGTPFTIQNSTANANRSFTAQSADRPNWISNPNSNAPHTVAQWFNTSAVATQAVGTFGTSGRNTVRGPHYINVDAAVARTFHVVEHADVQFRAEAFNLANHPNLYNPNGTATQVGTQAFGTITNAYAPRQFQFAVKVLF